MCETNELALIVLTKKPSSTGNHKGISQHALSYFLAAYIATTTLLQTERVNLAPLNGCQIQQRVVSQRLRHPDKPHFTLHLHLSFKLFVYYCLSAMKNLCTT